MASDKLRHGMAEKRCALDCTVSVVINWKCLLTHLFNQWQLCPDNSVATAAHPQQRERVVLTKIIWGWKAHFLNDGRYQPTFTFTLLWQFFYCLWFHFVVSRYTCPFVEKFSIDIETYYKPDTGNQADVFNLSAAEKRQRTIGERTWYWSWTMIKT